MEEFHDRAVVASLKRVCPRRHRIGLRRIPRPRGRGLIEAHGECGRWIAAEIQFHDRAVVASLKPL